MQIVVRDLSGKAPDKIISSSRVLQEAVSIMMRSPYSVTRIAELARCTPLTLHNWVDNKVSWGRSDIVDRVLAVCGYEIVAVPIVRH